MLVATEAKVSAFPYHCNIGNAVPKDSEEQFLRARRLQLAVRPRRSARRVILSLVCMRPVGPIWNCGVWLGTRQTPQGPGAEPVE